MSIASKNYLAFDTSYESGAVVLFDESQILFEMVLSKRNEHGRHICTGIEGATKFCAQEKLSIDGVFIGLGPGSFIGTRIGLATALGYSFAAALPLMGFCSHLALAYSLAPEENDVAVVMKASGELCYVSRYQRCGKNFTPRLAPKVLAPGEIAGAIAGATAIATNIASAITNANTNAAAITTQGVAPVITPAILPGPTPLGVAQSARARLNGGTIVDESATIKPNYVKAPSVSLPKKFSVNP